MKCLLPTALGLTLIVNSMPVAGTDQYAFANQQADATAGLYFSVPLGGKHTEKQKFEYGFSLRFNNQYNRYDGSRINGAGYSLEPLKLAFGKDGFNNLSLNGQNVLTMRDGRLTVEGNSEDEDAGVPNWVWWTAGIVVVSAAGVAAAASSIEFGKNNN